MNLKIITFLLTLLFVFTLQRKIEWDSIKPMQMSRAPMHASNTRKAVRNMKRESRIVSDLVAESEMFPYKRKVEWDSIKPMEMSRTPMHAPSTERIQDKKIKSRIVGGLAAKPRMFPYQAALNIDTPNGTFFCGGSVISKRTILTAAHCADGARGFVVLLGSNSLNKQTPGEMEVQTNTSIIHPDWNPNTLRNDIALVILNEDITFSDQISPVTLAPSSSQNDNIVGKKAIVSGWGKTSDFAQGITPNLRYTSVQTTESSDCEMYYGQFPPNDICVSGLMLRGSCSGDSGGPLTINGTQVGIVSFGGILCQAGIPDGYTRVAAYIDFIMENSDYQA